MAAVAFIYFFLVRLCRSAAQILADALPDTSPKSAAGRLRRSPRCSTMVYRLANLRVSEKPSNMVECRADEHPSVTAYQCVGVERPKPQSDKTSDIDKKDQQELEEFALSEVPRS